MKSSKSLSKANKDKALNEKPKPPEFWNFKNSGGFNPNGAKSSSLRVGGKRADAVLRKF